MSIILSAFQFVGGFIVFIGGLIYALGSLSPIGFVIVLFVFFYIYGRILENKRDAEKYRRGKGRFKLRR